MKKYLINTSVAVIIVGKLLCHWLYAEDSQYEELLRHFYYSSDFFAHFLLFIVFYIYGISKQDRDIFLFVAIIYMIEFVYYCLYMFEICSFTSSLESYSIFAFEIYFTYAYFFLYPYVAKWHK